MSDQSTVPAGSSEANPPSTRVSSAPIITSSQSGSDQAGDESDWRKRDAFLTFGPNRSYFLSLRSRWYYHGIGISTFDEIEKAHVGSISPTGNWVFGYQKHGHEKTFWRYSLNRERRDDVHKWEQVDGQCESTCELDDSYV